MDARFTTLTAWSYGIASAGFALVALQLGLRRSGAYGTPFWLAMCLSAAWAAFGCAHAITQEDRFLAAASAADVLRVGAWHSFVVFLILRSRNPGATGELRGVGPSSAVLVAIGLLAQVAVYADWNMLGEPARLAYIDSLCLAALVIVLVEMLFRNLPANARWGIKPLGIGLLAAFGFDIYAFAEATLFNRPDVEAFSVRGIVHAAVIPLIAVSALRSGSWNSKVTVSRQLVFHSVALTTIGLYLLFVASVGYYVRVFGGDWGRAFQIALLFAAVIAIVVLSSSGAMHAKLRVFVSKHFFRYRYDYREEWLRFTQTLSACDAQSNFGEQTIRGLAALVESPAGSLWLPDAGRRYYVQTARWNMQAIDEAEPASGSLAQFLRKSGWVVNLVEYRSLPGRYGGIELPQWLSTVPGAWLLVPLPVNDDLMGFVILATPRTRVELDWEVLDLLKTAGKQAASFIGHLRATEALLESRKFDSFNRMAAFVVHDLKNVIAQLSLMLKNAERHRDNPEFQQDMLTTIAHAVERMKHLMMQLGEGTTPVDQPSAVDVGEIIRRIERAKSGQQPSPEIDIDESVIAKGHADRVERVIGHLVQNAIDATEKSGRVWVQLRREDSKAVIEVRDTGSGMTAQFARESLFKPFTTTKEGGMGIGAYESYQYIHELGGDISVDTKPGYGTTMRVLLPLHEIHAEPAVVRKGFA